MFGQFNWPRMARRFDQFSLQ